MHWSLELKGKSSKALKGFSGSCALCSVSQSRFDVRGMFWAECMYRLFRKRWWILISPLVGSDVAHIPRSGILIRDFFLYLMSSGSLGSDPETTSEVLGHFQFHRESWLLDQMGITSSDQINVDCHVKFQKWSWNAKSYEKLRWRFYVSLKDHIALPIVSTIQPRPRPKYLST